MVEYCNLTIKTGVVVGTPSLLIPPAVLSNATRSLRTVSPYTLISRSKILKLTVEEAVSSRAIRSILLLPSILISSSIVPSSNMNVSEFKYGWSITEMLVTVLGR